MVMQLSAKVSIQTQVCLKVHFVTFLLHKQKLVVVDFCAPFIITTANIYWILTVNHVFSAS